MGTGYVALAAGADTSFAIKGDGSLWAWGIYNYGQLGLGPNYVDFANPSPQLVVGTNWKAAAGGSDHSLGLKADGSLWAWGNNEFGQLGLGDITNRASPAKVWPRANPGLNLLLLVN